MRGREEVLAVDTDLFYCAPGRNAEKERAMAELAIAALIGAWSLAVGIVAYLRLKREYEEREED